MAGGIAYYIDYKDPETMRQIKEGRTLLDSYREKYPNKKEVSDEEIKNIFLSTINNADEASAFEEVYSFYDENNWTTDPLAGLMSDTALSIEMDGLDVHETVTYGLKIKKE